MSKKKTLSHRCVMLAAFLTLGLFVLSCKSVPNFGPEQCDKMAKLAVSVSIRVTEVAAEDKAALVAAYGEIVEDLAVFGCAFVPAPIDE